MGIIIGDRNLCGIVAAIGKLTVKEEEMFKQMLQLDVLRGKDSVGMIAVCSQDNVYSDKEAWLPQDFLEKKTVKNIFLKQLKVLIGHNRYATVGAVDKAGAHPFEHENVIGVHNGTTDKYKFKGHTNCNVDSDALYQHVSEHGIDEAWSLVSGAASLIMYDKKDGVVNVVRNKERPMCYAYNLDGSIIFFASEPWIIEVAAARCNIQLKPVCETVEHSLIRINPLEIGGITSRELTPYKPPYVAPNRHLRGSTFQGLRNGSDVSFKVKEMVDFSVVNYQVFVEEENTKNECVIFYPKDGVYVEELKVVGRMWEGVIQYISEKYCSISAPSIKPQEATEETIRYQGGTCFTKTEFNTGDNVSNVCVYCGEPLYFEEAGVKWKGDQYQIRGVQHNVCCDCILSEMIDFKEVEVL